MSSRPLSLVWSPHKGSNQFLVDSNNDLRLYEYNPKEPTNLNFRTIVLPPPDPSSRLTYYAWSPDSNYKGLLAAGYSNGKIFLGNFCDEDQISTNASISIQRQSHGTLSIKSTRSCNAMAFCPYEPRLLAVGYERWRTEYSLLIWDVEQARIINSFGDNKNSGANSSFNEPSIKIGGTNGPNSQNDIGDLGIQGTMVAADGQVISRPSIVTSHSRIEDMRPKNTYGFGENVVSCSWYSNRKRLVSGVQSKNLKFYDLRKEGHTHVIPTRAVYGVTGDPHREHRIASYEDGNIYLWDDRFLASLEKDSNYITLYDIEDCVPNIAPVPLNRNPSFNGTDSVLNEVPPVRNVAGYVSAGMTDDESGIPILWKSRRINANSPKNLALFSWISTFTSPYNHFMTINKDVELRPLFMEEAPPFNWGSGGSIVISKAKSFFELDPTHEETLETTNERHVEHPEEKKNSLSVKGDAGQKQRVSLNPKLDHYEDTSRPYDMNKDSNAVSPQQFKSILTNQNHKSRDGEMDDNVLLVSNTLNLMQEDISVVMHKRAMSGYSMTCQVNEEIVKEAPMLKALWSWIAQAEKLADGKATIGNIDHSYHGVYSVWTAPAAIIKQSPKPSLRTEEVIGPETSNDNDTFTVTTSKLQQRKLSLTICGWGFEKNELENTLLKMEQSGNFEKAAGWALFHGETERAIEILNNSQNERLKLVSTNLASFYLSNREEYRENQLWQNICRSLSYEMGDPYLRAMFSYMASGNWDDVLREDELELRDRVGVALRFLDDDKLSAYLYETTENVKKTGNVAGVILTGLTPEG
ncbi:13046_t:CDS:10, partial [Acaulospora morrowiae]